MAERPLVVAIDGPAASGKGTLARRLSAELGYPHLDTGTLYRAVGLEMLRRGISPDDREAAAAAAAGLDVAALDAGSPALRREETGIAAAVVAAVPGVRNALRNAQREFAARPPGGAAGVVLEGRDIGTVICPAADVKLFLQATVEARARRRARELRVAGSGARFKDVLRDMKERDERDRTRETAPLVPADDATVIDTTGLDADAVFARAMSAIPTRNWEGPNVSTERLPGDGAGAVALSRGKCTKEKRK